MKGESVAPCLLVGSIAAMSVIQSDAARAQSSPTLLAATGTAATDSPTGTTSPARMTSRRSWATHTSFPDCRPLMGLKSRRSSGV
jgi:hypothetical protein